MLYGLMLPSGNDAAIALAYHVAGDVEQFAELMNAKAAELGMTETHFVNASGVYKGQHYSTARDMARLAAYAMQNETFREIVKTAEYTVPANEVRKNELHLVNTNRLVSDPKDSKFSMNTPSASRPVPRRRAASALWPPQKKTALRSLPCCLA